jgi:hypothetical protein
VDLDLLEITPGLTTHGPAVQLVAEAGTRLLHPTIARSLAAILASAATQAECEAALVEVMAGRGVSGDEMDALLGEVRVAMARRDQADMDAARAQAEVAAAAAEPPPPPPRQQRPRKGKAL